jgi:hypothetical protein
MLNHVSRKKSAALLFLMLLCAGARAQSPEKSALVTRKTYHELLDVLFPREESFDNSSRDGQVSFHSLRLVPSFEAESQINIVQHESGSVTVVVYLVSNKKNIWNQIVERGASAGCKDVKCLAELIPVKRQVIKSPDKELVKLIRQFSLPCASPAQERVLVHDGFNYNLLYEAGEYRMTISLTDSYPKHGPFKYPVAKWAAEILGKVQREMKPEDKLDY